MSKKFLSLDDQRNTIDIQVNRQTFSIARLTLSGQAKINEYLTAAAQAAYKTQEYEGRLKEMGLSAKPGHSFYDEVEKATNDYLKKSYELKEELDKAEQAAIKKILEDNGYTYDVEFWKEVDSGMPGKFIEAVATKDQEEGKGKKPVARK